MEFWNEGWKKKERNWWNCERGRKRGGPPRCEYVIGRVGRERERGEGRVISLARDRPTFEYRNPIRIYTVYRSNVSRWKFIHAVAHIHTRWVHRNFSTPSDAWKERPCYFRSSFSSIGDTVPVKQSRNLEFFLSLEKRIISGKIERQWTACSFGLMGNKGCEERGEIPSKVFSV